MNNQISRIEFIKKITSVGMSASLMPALSPQLFAGKQRTRNKSKSFTIQALHIDMRVEVMKIDALKNLVRDIASMGINALILEYEASYPYQKHGTLSNQYAYSRDDLKDFVSYCDDLGIQIIPLQENLGHVQYILCHNRYADLRIEPKILSQVDPLNKNAIPLFNDLIEDVVSLHPSKYIHLGGDEARHLKNDKFTDYIEKYSVSKLYTQYVGKICRIAIDIGKTPLLWADMILKYPEAVENLPVDKIIFVDWNYGWKINNFGNIKALQQKGCTFWGAPALRSGPDNYFITRWKKHFDNLKNYIPYTRGADYKGVIMTSWSTSGIYDYKWQGTSGEFLEMFPDRNVYPLSGFRILIAAYSEALEMNDAINPQQFVVDYGQARFGLSEIDAQILWNYLSYRQVRLGAGKAFGKKDIQKVITNFGDHRNAIDQLKPARHQQEFAHFKLMADIRLFYLSVRQVEAMVESIDFDRSKMDIVQSKLLALEQTAQQLDQRFIALNEGYLHMPEIERLNQLRNEKFRSLHEIYCDES